MTIASSPDRTPLERESDRIFSRYWLFGCLKQTLPAQGSYCAKRIAGRDVIFRRVGDEIRCMDNICAHRGSRILPAGYGNAELRCPVHGWKYDDQGRVERIPFESEYYGFTAAERANLGLRSYPCWTAGNLVFVNFAEQPLRPDEQFHQAFIDEITALSLLWDSQIHFLEKTMHGNWRLGIEMLLDIPHLPFVHRTSLSRGVDKPDAATVEAIVSAGANDQRPSDVRDLSGSGVNPADPSPRFWYSSVERWGPGDGYYNWMLFPNTHMCAANNGHSIQLETFEPLSDSESRVETYFGTCRRKDPSKEISPAVIVENFREGQRVFAEDIAVCEGQEPGRARALSQSLGKIEAAIVRFRSHAGKP